MFGRKMRIKGHGQVADQQPSHGNHHKRVFIIFDETVSPKGGKSFRRVGDMV